jgi:two-component system, chemotaxis family, response regulator Rcp1
MFPSMGRSRCHILSVTADDGEHAIMEVALRGLTVFTLERAKSADEALARIQDRPALTRPNLIVLSETLPRASREELLAAVKSSAATKAIPVVVFSSSLDAEEVNRIYDAGAACVVKTPEGVAEYAGVIRVFKVLWVQYARLPFSESLPHSDESL